MPIYRNKSVEEIRLTNYIEMGRLNANGLYPHLIQTTPSTTTNASNDSSDSTKPSSNSSSLISSSSPTSTSSLLGGSSLTPPIDRPLTTNTSKSSLDSEQLVIPPLTDLPSITPLNNISHIDLNATSSSNETQQSTDIYSQVLKFYEQHNPLKIPNIPHILRKYAGKEDVLLDKLRRKYGPNSVATSPFSIKSDQSEQSNDTQKQGSSSNEI